MEGAQRQRQKAFNAEFGEGTAVVLRLAQPYAGSGRTIVADSAFASVKTLVPFNWLLGLYFMGMVKTATKEYPLAYLKCWSSAAHPRGSHVVMEITCTNGSKMYALCWNDRKPKMIISNRGTTLPGTESVRVRHRRVVEDGEIRTQRYEKRIPRPFMVELFFQHFSAVDVHDHYRQGSLEMEREWLTHSWVHRIFATVLGMVIVDAFLAYRYEKQSENVMACSTVAFGEFTSRLAHQLIFNDFFTGRARREGSIDGELDDTSLPDHTLLALGDRPEYQRLKNTQGRAQRRCKICKRKASFYCATCSNRDDDRYFPLCGSMTGRTCYQQHLAAAQHTL